MRMSQAKWPQMFEDMLCLIGSEAVQCIMYNSCRSFTQENASLMIVQSDRYVHTQHDITANCKMKAFADVYESQRCYGTWVLGNLS